MGSQRVTPINQKESDRKSSTNATSQRSPNLLGHWVEGDRFQADSHPYQQAPGQDAFHSSQTRPLFRGLSHELQADAASSGMRVQAKMTIGAPGDRYEQEADRVAAQVVNQIHSPTSSNELEQSQGAIGTANILQKQTTAVSPHSSTGGISASPDLETAIHRERGSGRPLPEAVRGPMEQALGTDFSDVRIHTDARSDQLNRSIQAKAFATGQDIFFQHGAYQPGSHEGQEVIVHELTHVMQQAKGKISPGETQSLQDDVIQPWRDEDGNFYNGLKPPNSEQWKQFEFGPKKEVRWKPLEGTEAWETREADKRKVQEENDKKQTVAREQANADAQRWTEISKDYQTIFLEEPAKIRYTQDSASRYFTNGQPIKTLADSLRNGSVTAEAVEPLMVQLWESKLYSYDNRRLWAFKKAKRKVRCRFGSPKEIKANAFKLTGDGKTIQIR